MTETPVTILAIFAHPDDEIGVGSTLAHYSDLGVRTVLACATRGEAATIFCEDCATHETLPAVRTQELQCACDHLGIHELRWLDWPDGKIKDLPRDEAIGQVVALIREIRPSVILTHPENGLYPHPDHLAVFEIVRVAFDLAADPHQYEGVGLPWAAERLFTRAMPQSFFERAPGLAEFRVELNGEMLPFMATPDDRIDVTMNVEHAVPKRMAAWDCHRSQHNPKGFSSVMPDGLRQEMAANEHYILGASRLPLPNGVKDDLLAGLWREAAVSETPALADASRALAVEESDPTERLLRHMEGELASHLALIEVLRAYSADSREEKALPMYRELAQGEQEITYHLARTLRQAGGSPGKVAASEHLIKKSRKHEQTEHRYAFLRDQFDAVKSRLAARVVESVMVEEREVWEELALLVRSQLAMLPG